MRFVQHVGVCNLGICASSLPLYNCFDDSLELRAIILILTQEMKRLSFFENLAAEVAVSVDAVFDAHAKPTEHDGDDSVDVNAFLLRSRTILDRTYPPVLVPNMKLK